MQNNLLFIGGSKSSNNVLKSKWYCPITGWYRSGFPPIAKNKNQNQNY
jgi:hypothetical protein